MGGTMQHYISITYFSRALRTAMNGAILLACFFSIAACHVSDPDESNTTSGTIGPFVATSDIMLTVTSSGGGYYAPGKEVLLIDFKRADTFELLRVGSGDSLVVTMGSVSQSIEEVKDISCTGKIGPCRYIYYYRTVFGENPDGKPMTISFERLNGLSSHTTVTFPIRPTITEPAPGSVFSLATDTLSISWPFGEAGDETRLRLSTECGIGPQLWFLGAGSGYSFPAGTFQFSTDSEYCRTASELPLDLLTTRFRHYGADPAFAPSSSLELSLEDYITIRMQR